MTKPETHLGHHIGPAPTSEELGLTKPKPQPEKPTEVDATTYDEPIAGGPLRYVHQIPPHVWEPDFSEGEPALDSKICGFCGREHEDQKSGS